MIYPLFLIEGLQYFEFIFIVVVVRSDVNCQFVPVVTTNCVLIALISFIMKFYLLFRVNFLYSKVFFH